MLICHNVFKQDKEEIVSVIENLVALQDKDQIIRDLEREISDIPKRIEMEKSDVSRELESLVNARACLADIKKAMDDAQLDISAYREEILRLRKQQPDLRKQQEYSANLSQIEQQEQLIKEAEERIVMLRGDLADAEVAERECKSKTDEAGARVGGYVAELEARAEELRRELDAAMEERKELLAPFTDAVSKRYLSYYERFRQRNSWPVLVRISERGACDGCHMTLPMAKKQSVMRGRDVVTCDYCGRIVY